MSTEQRDVRPFESPVSLESLLRNSTLRFGDRLVEQGGRVVVEEHEFLHFPAVLMVAKQPDDVAAAVSAASESLKSLGLSVEHLGFAVLLQSSFLKLMDVVVDMPFTSLVGGPPTFEISSAPRPRALRAPRSGCNIEVLIYLRDDRPRQPRRPWRFGTWLARASFEIVTDIAFTGFTPQPLTAAVKVAKGLAPKTARYVTLGAVSPLDVGVTEDVVEVWCDADLLAKMSANGKAPGSVTLQRQLFVDAIAAIVDGAAAEKEALASSAWADVEHSLLGRVISLVVPSGSSEAARLGACTTYLEMIKNDRAVFMSWVEEVAGLLGAYDGIIGG